MEPAGWEPRAQSDTCPSPQASLLRWLGGGSAFTNRSVCAWHVNLSLPRLQGQLNKILEASGERLLRPGPGMGSAELRASGQDTASPRPVGVESGGCRPQQSWCRIRGTPSPEVGGVPSGHPLCHLRSVSLQPGGAPRCPRIDAGCAGHFPFTNTRFVRNQSKPACFHLRC